MKKIIIVLLGLILVSVVIAQSINYISDKVQKIDDCKDIYWEEEEKIYGTCSDLRLARVCEDEPYNTTCNNVLIPYNYTCLKETNIIQKSKKECETSGFIVNEIIKLHTKNYACVTEEDKDIVTVMCESRFDSNEDGICKPGESCIKFIINGDKVERYERNSRYDWVKSDKSFFVERASAEVLK